MIEYIKKWFDGSAISVGLLALCAYLFLPQEECHLFCDVLCYMAGCLGMVYVTYGAWLWFKRRIDFDWHLINGHFLRKVICIVLLMPFSLTTLTVAINRFVAPLCESPKELVYDDKIYAPEDNNLDFIKESQQESPTLFWTVLYHFMSSGNQNMATTKMGRAYSTMFSVLGLFMLNGLLVSSIIGWVDRRKERWLKGEVRYPSGHLKKNHFAVVIGANEVAASVIKNLLKGKEQKNINFSCEGYNRYVILQTSRDVQEIKSELASHLSEEELRRVILYRAARDAKLEIAHLHIEQATEVYVLGESTLIHGGETYHDTMNMRCVNLIAEYLEGIKTGLDKKVCKVMFEYQTTYSVFQFSDISDTVKRNLVFIPFNRYESWARKVIVEGYCQSEEGEDKAIRYMPLDGDGLDEDSEDFVHLVIVGMSKMGIAMGVQCLMQAHYLNYAKARTRITFIDTNADKEKDFFVGRYANLFELMRHRYWDAGESETCCPWIDPMEGQGDKWRHLSKDGKNFLDVEMEFVKGELESDGVRGYLKQVSGDKHAKLTIAICLTQAHQAVAASLYMPVEVYKNKRLGQIWVYQRESADIISNLNNENNQDLRYKKLRPFGMLYGEYMTDRALYLKGMLTNVAYDIANGYNQAEWPADFSNRADRGYANARMSWKKLSVDKKWSNKYFADSMYIKIRSLLAGEPDFRSVESIREALRRDKQKTAGRIRAVFKEKEEELAKTEHNRWTVQQILMGYSPCDKELDMILQRRRAEGESERVKEAYLLWKQKHLEESACTRGIKNDIKECALRIHPNICDYEHLEDVDSGAQQYDKDLNNSIATIISLVDGYGG